MRLPAPAFSAACAVAGLLVAGASASRAQARDAQVAPAILQGGTSLGEESPETPLRLTAWLALHNRAELDARVAALYSPGSPTYHKWMTAADFGSYLPTAAEVAAVRAELEAHHLAVASVDPFNLAVRFTGRSADVESAFGTEVNRYRVNGVLVRTTASQPLLRGAAAGLVQHLAGLNSLAPAPTLVRAPHRGASSADATSDAASQCFNYPVTETVSGAIVLSNYGPFPEVQATFSGLVYGPNTLGSNRFQPPCGYTPAQVQGFYGADIAQAMGYTGAGQTVVFVDAFPEPQILADANAFNTEFGLPALGPANFQEYNPFGATDQGLNTTGGDVFSNWLQESDLGVEWAHAIAPGAGIAVVQAYSAASQDLQEATLYAVAAHLGNVVAGTFAQAESAEGFASSQVWNEIIELGAAEGISMHFPSGDQGDYSAPRSAYVGSGVSYTFSPTQVSAPADSPYATAIGGTSVALSPTGDATFVTGWGSSDAGVYDQILDRVYVPPAAFFDFGSGGGASAYFPKPAYQASLAGNSRLLPDVAALADPFTPAQRSGGTGLATAIFSGIWAIADQYAGGSLGQAAPLLARDQGAFLTDVLPVMGPDNVTGTATTAAGTTQYGPGAFVPPLFGATAFTTGIELNYDYIYGYSYDVISFGTDLSLLITPGWDDVTGWGTPNIGNALRNAGAKPFGQ